MLHMMDLETPGHPLALIQTGLSVQTKYFQSFVFKLLALCIANDEETTKCLDPKITHSSNQFSDFCKTWIYI